MEGKKIIVTKDTIISDAIKISPLTEKIIEKHFGNGCFNCPGVKMETIGFGASMHGIDAEIIVTELNSILI